MIGKLRLLVLAVVLLGGVVLLGSLRLLHPGEGYVLVGVPVMGLELAMAVAVARGWVVSTVADFMKNGRVRGSILVAITLIATAMLPTFAILFANQALDGAAGVTQTLPVLSTTQSHGRGSSTYYAAVPATPPPLFMVFGADGEIRLPYETWRTLVPGESKLTLTVHAGRFGLPWYDVVGTASRLPIAANRPR